MSESCPFHAPKQSVQGDLSFANAITPRGWPFLGNLPELLWNILLKHGNFIAGVRRMLGRHSTKTLDLRIGPRRFVLTVDPAVAHEILVTAAHELPKTAWEERVLGPAMEGGSIILHGEPWKRHRGVVASCFGSARMADLAHMTRASLAARLGDWKGEIALGHEFRSVVNDVMFRFFMDTKPTDVDELARSALEMEKGLEQSVFRWTHGQGFRKSLNALTERISTRVKAAAHFQDSGPALRSMLGKLPPNEVSQEIRTVIAAGATTSHLLAWISYLLATNPEVQSRLRAEVRTLLGPAGGPPDSLTDLEALPFLSAVIHEGLRLYPPAPFLLRQSEGKRTGYYFVAVWAMHRELGYWEMPERFAPERWLEASGTFREKMPEAFIPFGLGPRTCVGKRFALIEARVMLVEILRRFEILPVAGVRPPSPVFYVLTRPDQEPRLKVRAA